jgi:hypothetical protein
LYDAVVPRRTSVLLSLIAVVALIAGVWWFAFGTLSPCESMRLQARRVGSDKAGVVGRVAADALTALRAGDFTPWECTVTAVKLKLFGVKALEDLVRHGAGH